ncbi:hypothetical protein MKX40_30215 [Paenibacillus sp. FSL R5-0517]|uniref:hypothetical protein n=1 Tax=Paenibacillus sp. FSL R5-0517 TaxID=2921647 RepID=UPI0030D86B89
MKKKLWVSLLTIPLTFASVGGYVYLNQPTVVSAQSDVESAAQKSTHSNVEYIKETLEDGSYNVRYRDRVNLIEITEEYRENKLYHKMIVEDGGKKVTSYGRDFESGKLVGNTWTMPKNIAAENAKLLQISLLENAKQELQKQKWTVLEPEGAQARSLAENNEKQAVSEDELRKEIVTINVETGLPTKRVIYMKDKNGEIVSSTTKTEEYKYLDSLPMKVQKMTAEESVEIKEIPAPVIEDKVFEGS